MSEGVVSQVDAANELGRMTRQVRRLVRCWQASGGVGGAAGDGGAADGDETSVRRSADLTREFVAEFPTVVRLWSRRQWP